MSNIDDGGKAFPQFDVVAGERDGHGDAIEAYTTATGGLSRRDYFAAAALTGMLTRSDYDDNTIAEVVDTALCYADALIAASKSRGSDE